jgi:DNA-directed RNA polymerase specialized sigma24 family protein
MAYDEIASVIDCPLGTVKSRLFNARLQLRSLLKNYMTP